VVVCQLVAPRVDLCASAGTHAQAEQLTLPGRDGTGSPGYGSSGHWSAFWPGRVGSRVSVSDPVFDPFFEF